LHQRLPQRRRNHCAFPVSATGRKFGRRRRFLRACCLPHAHAQPHLARTRQPRDTYTHTRTDRRLSSATKSRASLSWLQSSEDGSGARRVHAPMYVGASLCLPLISPATRCPCPDIWPSRPLHALLRPTRRPPRRHVPSLCAHMPGPSCPTDSFPFPAVLSSRHHTCDSAFCTTVGRSIYDLALRISAMTAMCIIAHTSNRPIHGSEHTRLSSSASPGPSFHSQYPAYNLWLPLRSILGNRCRSFEQLGHQLLDRFYQRRA
jgi:hypothetical protein